MLHTDLIGGEPLLHPDLDRLLARITGHGMTTGLTTNGFLLTEERLDALRRRAWDGCRSPSIAPGPRRERRSR